MFDRTRMTYYPLSERKNFVDIERARIDPRYSDFVIDEALVLRAETIASEILAARERDASVILAFGAHAIKNGLGWLLGEMGVEPQVLLPNCIPAPLPEVTGVYTIVTFSYDSIFMWYFDVV